LIGNIFEGDVVVTHHLPSERLISPKFRANDLNRFYVCPMDFTLERKNPKAWVFGHTHDSAKMKIGKTSMICNPYGYYDQEVNPKFNPSLTI
jgi:Icc-related predicted phosphoesterase